MNLSENFLMIDSGSFVYVDWTKKANIKQFRVDTFAIEVKKWSTEGKAQ